MSDKTNLVLNDLEEVKGIVHLNIVNLNHNLTDLDDLEQKAETLRRSSEVWKKQTMRMKLTNCWITYKSNILSALIISFTILMVLIIIFTSK